MCSPAVRARRTRESLVELGRPQLFYKYSVALDSGPINSGPHFPHLCNVQKDPHLACPMEGRNKCRREEPRRLSLLQNGRGWDVCRGLSGDLRAALLQGAELLQHLRLHQGSQEQAQPMVRAPAHC